MLMPNCYPDSYPARNGRTVMWKELDILATRKSGYLDELEVKISRSDFRADFKKDVMAEVESTTLSGCTTTSYENRNKHKMLEYGQGIPNYFWFMTLKGIVKEEDIPEYAGWIEVEPMWNTRTKKWYMDFEEKKKPKLLHKDKPSGLFITNVYKKGYYRYIDLLTGG